MNDQIDYGNGWENVDPDGHGLHTQTCQDPDGSQPKAPKGRVLVVDDDPTVRSTMADLLEWAGFAVRVAPDGPTALAIFDGDPFDMVFLDLLMPGMNGLELAAAVRKADPRIPIVLVTGHASLLDAVVIAQTGIDWVLSKPFSLDDIITCTGLSHQSPDHERPGHHDERRPPR
jgi:CheY-like chemotaxis protein